MVHYREIVNITGLSRKTVERHLEALKHLGLIYEDEDRVVLVLGSSVSLKSIELTFLTLP